MGEFKVQNGNVEGTATNELAKPLLIDAAPTRNLDENRRRHSKLCLLS
jgi:hypothetical protein